MLDLKENFEDFNKLKLQSKDYRRAIVQYKKTKLHTAQIAFKS